MVSIATGGDRREDAAPPRVHPLWRLGVLALVVAGLFTALALGLPQKLSLSQLRAEHTALQGFVQAHPWQSLLVYVALYVAVVALSMPGALVMTLSGGFLFGALEGGAAAVTGVSLGSVLMFLLARTAAGEGVRAWLSHRTGLMKRLEDEVREHPFTTTLTLRLIPAAPICLVNLAAGFVRIRLLPYALATVLGVIPSTFLYASVGQGLDRLFGTVQTGSLLHVIRTQLVLPALGLMVLVALPLALRWWTGRRRVAQRPAVQ